MVFTFKRRVGSLQYPLEELRLSKDLVAAGSSSTRFAEVFGYAYRVLVLRVRAKLRSLVQDYVVQQGSSFVLDVEAVLNALEDAVKEVEICLSAPLGEENKEFYAVFSKVFGAKKLVKALTRDSFVIKSELYPYSVETKEGSAILGVWEVPDQNVAAALLYTVLKRFLPLRDEVFNYTYGNFSIISSMRYFGSMLLEGVERIHAESDLRETELDRVVSRQGDVVEETEENQIESTIMMNLYRMLPFYLEHSHSALIDANPEILSLLQAYVCGDYQYDKESKTLRFIPRKESATVSAQAIEKALFFVWVKYVCTKNSFLVLSNIDSLLESNKKELIALLCGLKEAGVQIVVLTKNTSLVKSLNKLN